MTRTAVARVGDPLVPVECRCGTVLVREPSAAAWCCQKCGPGHRHPPILLAPDLDFGQLVDEFGLIVDRAVPAGCTRVSCGTHARVSVASDVGKLCGHRGICDLPLREISAASFDRSYHRQRLFERMARTWPTDNQGEDQ